jgi:hypothetical protein
MDAIICANDLGAECTFMSPVSPLHNGISMHREGSLAGSWGLLGQLALVHTVSSWTVRDVQSQTVVFDSAPCPPPPILQPAHAEQQNVAAMLQADSDNLCSNAQGTSQGF